MTFTRNSAASACSGLDLKTSARDSTVWRFMEFPKAELPFPKNYARHESQCPCPNSPFKMWAKPLVWHLSSTKTERIPFRHRISDALHRALSNRGTCCSEAKPCAFWVISMDLVCSGCPPHTQTRLAQVGVPNPRLKQAQGRTVL